MKELETGSAGSEDPLIAPMAGQAMASPILVAVDFSAEAENALAWACDYAQVLDAPIEVLHVVHDPAWAPGTYRPDNGDPLEPMADVAERKLATFLDDARTRHPQMPDNITTSCIQGLPVDTILGTAQARGARLLVVGCRGLNGAARLLHGSISQEVARKAQIPVTIVKAPLR